MKKNNKLNRKWIVLFTLFFGVIFSCNDDILEQTNPNNISPDTFWRNSGDAEKGLVGCYSPMTGVRFYGRMYVFLSDYRDDLVNGFNESGRTAAGRFAGTSEVADVLFVWEEMWKVIARTNELLLRVPNIDFENEDEKNSILGEALFLRSLMYFELVNSWRNIPLITKPISIEESMQVIQAPPEDVYAQIIEDLMQARGMLPQIREGNEVGRITWGAATTLLGRVYLHTQQFSLARDQFKEVIDSNLYSLVDKYQDNFRNATENNSESIFELQMANNGNRGWGGDNAGTGRANSVVPDFAPPPNFTNQNGMRINQWALDLFLDEQTVNGEIDPRTFFTLFWKTNETTTYEGEVLSAITYDDQTHDMAFGPMNTNIYANKYVFADAEEGNAASNFHQTDSNWRYYRYADVLLMFAEAEVETSGVTQQAIDAINLVRRRVDMSDFDLTMTMQDIRDERVKELSLEHSRYFDLLRWGIVKERIVDIPDIKSQSGGVGAYQPGREYIDIPQRDLDTNPNFQHNPGY